MEDHGFVVGSKYWIQNYMISETYVNPETSVVESVEELRSLAKHYIDPIFGDSGSELLDLEPETNKVSAKCQSQYCNLCEDFNLTQCMTCWGRFGDPDRY